MKGFVIRRTKRIFLNKRKWKKEKKKEFTGPSYVRFYINRGLTNPCNLCIYEIGEVVVVFIPSGL